MSLQTIQAQKSTDATKRLLNNREAFLAYNISRLREMIRYLSPKKLELFQTIPFLLHINRAEFPGYVDTESPPSGIYKFEKSGFWKQAVKAYRIKPDDLPGYVSGPYHIHGVYLMGSSGTIGQTDYSDFDYWLIIDKSVMAPSVMDRFHKRLSEIEDWSQTIYGQQVKFFLLDIHDLRSNNFSAIDAESSGTAQKTLLKEEFYRTFILVAGKIPYWAILPVGLTDCQYDRWIGIVSRSKHRKWCPEDYIDLGNLESINRAECLGALLWQVYKSRTDPVKSLIKSALIAYYYFYGDRKSLLCDHVKQRFSERQLDSYLVDPYLVIFEKIVAFFEKVNDSQGLQLVKECIMLRLRGYPFSSHLTADSPKHALFDRLCREWAWDETTIRRFERYPQWSEREKRAFDDRIFDKLMSLYELILRTQDQKNPPFDMTFSDLKSLTNRIAVWFQKQPSKIPRCSTYLSAQTKNRVLSITCNGNTAASDDWSVYDGNRSARDNTALLYSGNDILQVAGWILQNRLHRNSRFSFESNTCAITADRANRVFKTTGRFFSGPSIESEESRPVEKLLVALTPGRRMRSKNLDRAEFLLRNKWNEFHFWSLHLARVDNVLLKCYKIAMEILGCIKRAPDQQLRYIIEPIGVNADTHTIETIENLLMKNRQKKNAIDIFRTADGTKPTKPERLINKALLDRYDGQTT